MAWVLAAALATVAAIAARRLLRGSPSAGSIVHLAMALGMALMLLPGAAVSGPVLSIGFAVLGAAVAVRERRHGLHHAVMCGIMALMAAPARGETAAAMPQMASAPSAILLAAFGYAFVLVVVFAWRMPSVVYGGGADPLGHACEITMLTSTVVMLLPMV